MGGNCGSVFFFYFRYDAMTVQRQNSRLRQSYDKHSFFLLLPSSFLFFRFLLALLFPLHLAFSTKENLKENLLETTP